MKTRLVGSISLGLGLFLLCLLQGGPEVEQKMLLALGLLIVLSDLTALPVPRRGHLSFAFVWAFVLAQIAPIGIVTVIVSLSLLQRVLIMGKGSFQERALDFLTEWLPMLLAFLALGWATRSSSYGFPRGHLGAVASLLVFYGGGRVCLSQLYVLPVGGQLQYLEGATQSRELQFRLCTMLAPAATLLISSGLTGVLWMLPVMLGLHQFLWDKLLELKGLREQSTAQGSQLQKKSSALKIQSKELSETRREKEISLRCLEAFTTEASLEQTAQIILRLASEVARARRYILFWDQDGRFGPLLTLNESLNPEKIQASDFPERALLSQCYAQKKVLSNVQKDSWCFPLHEGGVIYLGGLLASLDEGQKRELTLLASQSSFGLRSAVLFERLKETLAEEQVARDTAVRAKHQLEMTQAHLVQSSKMAAVGQLAAGVAHELNSPLAAILLAVQAGKRSLQKGRPEKAMDRFVKCEEATVKAKHIVNGLLTHSRKSDEQSTSFDLQTVVAETCEFLRERLGREGTDCRLVGSSSATVLGNSDEVSQILTNLILNSHQAMSGLSERTIELTLREDPDLAIVEIRDFGPGIAPEAQSRIFEPFFTTKNQGEGTGLGLYISSELAQKNQGRLELVSSSKSKTVFRLSLPKA